ncbi:MAG: hypothetical protein K8Q97_04305 [Candidatus Andersenbacteria bacterium]|nr:hypothetical protein [Candidatus Andersenbacteria bacterium]
MITGNVIQITGLYFQLCPAKGIQGYWYQGILFRECAGAQYRGFMIDENGLAKLSAITDHPEQGRGFIKEYIGNPPYHAEPIAYRFHAQFDDQSYWIGRYELSGGKMWGEAHATFTFLEDDLCRPEDWINWYSVAWKEVVRKIRKLTRLLPPAFTHISLPPRIPYSPNNEALPSIDEYGEDIAEICRGMISEQRSFLEAWATVYSRCALSAQQQQWSVKELLQNMRRALGRSLQSMDIFGSLLATLLLSNPPGASDN